MTWNEFKRKFKREKKIILRNIEKHIKRLSKSNFCIDVLTRAK